MRSSVRILWALTAHRFHYRQEICYFLNDYQFLGITLPHGIICDIKEWLYEVGETGELGIRQGDWKDNKKTVSKVDQQDFCSDLD
jgi:hypothetical protein